MKALDVPRQIRWSLRAFNNLVERLFSDQSQDQPADSRDSQLKEIQQKILFRDIAALTRSFGSISRTIKELPEFQREQIARQELEALLKEISQPNSMISELNALHEEFEKEIKHDEFDLKTAVEKQVSKNVNGLTRVVEVLDFGSVFAHFIPEISAENFSTKPDKANENKTQNRDEIVRLCEQFLLNLRNWSADLEKETLAVEVLYPRILPQSPGGLAEELRRLLKDVEFYSQTEFISKAVTVPEWHWFRKDCKSLADQLCLLGYIKHKPIQDAHAELLKYEAPWDPLEKYEMADAIILGQAIRLLEDADPNKGILNKALQTNTSDQLTVATMDPVPSAHLMSHSDGYRTINKYGKIYELTVNQAAIIAKLWNENENGTPSISIACLIESVGCESKRMRDIWKGNEEAKTALISKGKYLDMFRLNIDP